MARTYVAVARKWLAMARTWMASYPPPGPRPLHRYARPLTVRGGTSVDLGSKARQRRPAGGRRIDAPVGEEAYTVPLCPSSWKSPRSRQNLHVEHRSEIRKALTRFWNRVRHGHLKVVVFGLGGVGKSTLGKLLSGVTRSGRAIGVTSSSSPSRYTSAHGRATTRNEPRPEAP